MTDVSQGDNDWRRMARERASALLAEAVPAAQRMAAAPNWPMTSALALAFVSLAELSVYGNGSSHDFWLGALLLVAPTTVALAYRYSHPRSAATIVTLVTALSVSGTTPWTIAGIAGELWVLYILGTRCRRRWWLLALPLLMAALGAAGSTTTAYDPPPAPLVVILALGALAFGDSRRLRREAIAERDATRLAMADTLEGQAVLRERARIAREMHDVVAHHISAISVQAETARLTTEGMPEEGQQRLEAIGDTARDALTEMRRVLGVLRAEAGDDPDRTPQPGLDRLGELLDTARAAGTRVRLILEGRLAPLPPGVDLTAYRIVQEALTNARRHAPGASVDVELRYGDDALHLRVRDNGPGPPDGEPTGHGLTGMRERAAMVGGTLRAGAAETGGFAVEAELPIAREAPV
jgi:signal transduction histidine kinase